MGSAGKTYFNKRKCWYKHSVWIFYPLLTCIALKKTLMYVAENKQN